MKTLAAVILLLTLGNLTACSSGTSLLEAETATFGSAASEPPTNYPGGDCFTMDYDSCQAFKATNLQRAMNDLAPMVFCQTCFEMAFDQSKFMNDTGHFDHQRPDETFAQRVTRFGLTKGSGENIAWGRLGAPVVDMWMNSPGHRANILNAKYKSFAIATYGQFTTQVFYVDTDK